MNSRRAVKPHWIKIAKYPLIVHPVQPVFPCGEGFTAMESSQEETE